MNQSCNYNAGIFCSLLEHAANQAAFARWFVIDHDDDDDPHTLCCFMHLTYSSLIMFLESCELTDYYFGTPGPSAAKISSLVTSLDNVEHTRYKMSFGGKRRNYQFLHIGSNSPGPLEQNYTFGMQIRLEKDRIVARARRPQETCYHRLI